MFSDHRGRPHWTCFACASSEQHPNFDRKDEFITHIKGQHGEGITSQQIPILLSAWLHTSPVLIRSCPLCSYSHENWEVILSHTAEHIHSFSLMSLPWPSTKEEDSDVYGDYFKHHKYFNMDQTTHDSMQASSSAASQKLDSDLPSIDFEPSTESTLLTKERLELLSQNIGSGADTAHWLDLILDESEGADPLTFSYDISGIGSWHDSPRENSGDLDSLNISSHDALFFSESMSSIDGWRDSPWEQSEDLELLDFASQDTSSYFWITPFDQLDSISDESKGASPSTTTTPTLENASSPNWDLSENMHLANRHLANMRLANRTSNRQLAETSTSLSTLRYDR